MTAGFLIGVATPRAVGVVNTLNPRTPSLAMPACRSSAPGAPRSPCLRPLLLLLPCFWPASFPRAYPKHPLPFPLPVPPPHGPPPLERVHLLDGSEGCPTSLSRMRKSRTHATGCAIGETRISADFPTQDIAGGMRDLLRWVAVAPEPRGREAVAVVSEVVRSGVPAAWEPGAGIGAGCRGGDGRGEDG